MIKLDERIKLQHQRDRSLEQSLFYQRLCNEIVKKYDNNPLKPELENLIRTVKRVTEQADIISTRIIEILPHYTLHNETHFYNVLAFMEQMVPEKTMADLSALECALAILAAFTHDLAMVIPLEEKSKILGKGPHKGCGEHKEFLNFCIRQKQYGEVMADLENRLSASASEKREDIEWRIEILTERLLGDYIRSTHSHKERGYNCINTWLTAFEADNKLSFTYNGLPFKSLLCFLDVSHGQGMSWIEGEMVRKNRELKDVYTMSAADGTVNLAYLSWLLHLADLLDCDASRTPPIIYRHIGITDQVSKAHWEKHLSVHSVDFQYNEAKHNFDLTFISHSCPSPIIHKMILDHIKQVNFQVAEIRTAMYTAPFGDRGKYILNLPVAAKAEIHEERDVGDKKKYLYNDICFELDQEEIFKILMGQELYGEPGLCLRELIQNSLDALQLRDLHCRIPRDKRFRPVDVIDNGERLQVNVDWGEGNGKSWISVSDNGTGMTKKVIKKYFTQIGKSYYNSPGYRSEREKLKELLQQSPDPVKTSTPISKFGIGILSCFMIADRIEVKTCPMRDGSQQLHIHPDLLQPYDITICGPGSLFWLKEGTRTTCGTEVKLLLKREFSFFDGETQSLLNRLREHFYDSGKPDEISKIPTGSVYIPWEIYKTVIWPMYPIVFPDDLPILDHRFHFDHLLTIDQNKFTDKLKEWHIPEKAAGEPGWAFIDWTDETTGSRIRLAMVSPGGKKADLFKDTPGDSLFQYEYNAFIETQLSKKNRFIPMINSMNMENWKNFPLNAFLFFVHMGAVLWIDYRSSIMPELKADRKGFTSKITEGIEENLKVFYKNYLSFLTARAGDDPVTKKQLLMSLNAPLLREKFSSHNAEPDVINVYSFLNENITPIIHESGFNNKILLLKSFFYMDISFPYKIYLASALARTRNLALDRDLDRDGDLDLDRDPSRDSNLVRASERDLALALDLALFPDLDLVCDLNRDYARDLDLELYQTRTYYKQNLIFFQFNTILIANHFLSEVWEPSFAEALPPIVPFDYQGKLSHCILQAPLVLLCQFHEKKMVSRDHIGRESNNLVFGYDLCVPFTAIPLGELRGKSETWEEDRSLRAVALLPFLFPDQIKKWNYKKEVFTDLKARIGVPSILLLIPDMSLWNIPFGEWTTEDKQNKCYSGLWNIEENRVLWMPGVVSREVIFDQGKTVEELVEEKGGNIK